MAEPGGAPAIADAAASLERLPDAGWRDAILAPIGRAAVVDAIDLVRIRLDSGGAVHSRASGNAPELRCHAEAVGQGDGNRWPILPEAQ